MAFGSEGKPFLERRIDGAVILRNPSIPVRNAFAWWLLFSWVGPLGMWLVVDALFPLQSPTGRGAFSLTVLGFLVLCLRSGLRSLRARVVVTADGLSVHNTFSTTRIDWAEVEGIEMIDFLNVSAVLPQRWYGVALRVAGRRRPVGVLASWAKDSQSAAAFADRIRALGPQPYPAWFDERWDQLPDSLRQQYPRLGLNDD